MTLELCPFINVSVGLGTQIHDKCRLVILAIFDWLMFKRQNYQSQDHYSPLKQAYLRELKVENAFYKSQNALT